MFLSVIFSTRASWIYVCFPVPIPPDAGRQTKQNQSCSLLLRFLVHSNGLNGTISVYPLEGSMAGMMPTPASANSPTAYTILDVDQNAYLFVGGIIGTVKVCVCPSVCVRQRLQLVYPIVFISPCLFRKQTQ